jgi:hypothetical protein
LRKGPFIVSAYVVGIVPTEDIEELERLLGGVQGLDRSKLTVLTAAERTERHDRSFLDFIHADGAKIGSDVMGELADGSGTLGGGYGVGMPGIENVGNLGVLRAAHVVQRLGTLPIPDDEADNYNDALDDGRCIVTYQCETSACDAAENALRKAGALRVKTYR